MRKKVMIFSAAVVILTAVVFSQMGHLAAGTDVSSDDTTDSGYEYYYNEDEGSEGNDVPQTDQREEDKASPLIKVDTDPESITVLVNREYLLPEEYIPADLVVPNISFSFYGTYEKSYMRQVAATALEQFFAAASEKGYMLKGVSAYRSYTRQKQIYDKNVSTRGAEKTDKVSAKPGSSEHQTGLTIDISSNTVGCALEESFGRTEEGKWVAKNCYKYGFIIRYPKGKTGITGYSYEPWHIRYVGKNLAKYLYKNDLTLEEYYQTTTEDNKVAPDEPIVDTDIGAPAEPEMTAAPTPNPSYKPKASASPTPKATKKPKKKKPKATKKPVVTQKPSSTKRPAATKQPSPTKHPEITPQPTKHPAATPQPTKVPEETTAPEMTEKPVEGDQTE